MDFFEKSQCDIHPAYASRTLDNMKELADGTVQNANKILSCINNQRQAVDEAVLKAQYVQSDTAVSIRKLDDAAKRHRDDAAALRAELAQLKEVISKSASDCQACYEACTDSEAKCEDAKLHCLKAVANLHARMSAHTRQSEEFKCGQYHVVNRARSRSPQCESWSWKRRLSLSLAHPPHRGVTGRRARIAIRAVLIFKYGLRRL